ncbi:Indoleamine 2,3-dioxygenase [Leucoagaricus sp. SymC.cos]|nr:Indoleamine 2,3-dioxygenase [Leucoagaricus sp. SymC.cos]
MPPQPPLTRLPSTWEPWESLLDEAAAADLQVGDKLDLTNEDAARAERWRLQVRQGPVSLLPVVDAWNIALCMRAHLVLAFLQQFYVQSLPTYVSPIIIPRSIAIPLLRISRTLDLPPILTYSDTVLYNWHVDPTRDIPTENDKEGLPTPETVRTHTMFTNTIDEEEFYLCSARIELRGVEALELMRMMMDEMFVGDAIAIHRISGYLKRMTSVIDNIRTLLLDVKKLCRPDIYYNVVRPWLRGEDSDAGKRKWIFEGVDENQQPAELSGPSAGQSALVHVLDIYLGVDHQASATPQKPSFMNRMQIYMPRNHRLFLNHLAANPRPLRAFVMRSQDQEMIDVYNRAVVTLKELRDAHMIITTLFVVGPARRAARAALERKEREMEMEKLVADGEESSGDAAKSKDDTLRGTGGTDLVKFLKDTRTRTTEAVIQK